jgi:hypothetical protein
MQRSNSTITGAAAAVMSTAFELPGMGPDELLYDFIGVAQRL